ncbi:MAG: hypothetical protein HY397_01970 [Candidatus Doudnabacteria bacterium]|nr:hypothetical protein [Candidatus Doudnabacteria bacterium]
MQFLTKKIASRNSRRWFITFTIALAVLVGFEALSFLTGIYQIRVFLQVSILIYFYLLVKTSLIFDLHLKIPKSWHRSSGYYHYSKKARWVKFSQIVFRALSLRFHYLFSWPHWKHFQNYLILPSVLYWAVVLLVFLNPFDLLLKQFFVISGTLLMTVVMWHLKVVFVNYSGASLVVRYFMFAVMVVTAFLIFSAGLGITWYAGLPAWHFPLTSGIVALLLLYQSLFHHPLINTLKNFGFVLLGAALVGVTAVLVQKFWTVNYYTAGLLMAGFLHLYWSVVLQALQKRLTVWRAVEYATIFLFIVIYVLATTNFHARIG